MRAGLITSACGVCGKATLESVGRDAPVVRAGPELTAALLLSLPAIAIGKGLVAVVFRMTRAAVLDQLTRDHVKTARAKGLPAHRVLTRHVIRNALTPIATVLGLQMGSLLGGNPPR